jgi:hypothetical protein
MLGKATRDRHKIDTNATNIDTIRVKRGLYATMLHGKKPKKCRKCNHVAAPHGNFGSFSTWGRLVISWGITQKVLISDKKCK